MHLTGKQVSEHDQTGIETKGIPQTSRDLTIYGWDLVSAELARAESDRVLVTHWLLTAEDSSVHSDEHFGSNERTTNFVHVVLPTLADQLAASHLVAAVPWDQLGEPALLALVAWVRGEQAVIDARPISRLGLEVRPPWWSLAAESTTPPPELAEAIRSL
jgi:hypothetical protein